MALGLPSGISPRPRRGSFGLVSNDAVMAVECLGFLLAELRRCHFAWASRPPPGRDARGASEGSSSSTAVAGHL
jgi:hypothetical protein